jgi:hypothetical protein
MSGKKASKVIAEAKNRFSQFTEFLMQVVRMAECSNVDHYFRAGSISAPGKIKESYCQELCMEGSRGVLCNT